VDLPGHLSARVDDQLLPGSHLAIEPAADLRDIDADGAMEGAALGDLITRASIDSFDPALDDERVRSR
jgi:hypothetical protein